MAQQPSNSAIGRERSAEARKKSSRQHDLRIAVALAQAAVAGADSLKSLVEILNRASVPTRRGGQWSINLVAHELKRMGRTAKGLHADLTKPLLHLDGGPTDWSEEAFWRVIEEQSLIAEQNGEWRSVATIAPKRNDVIRHPEHGIGHFVRASGANLSCKFHSPTGSFLQTKIRPVDLEVFVWNITLEARQVAFARINERYLVQSARVNLSNITLEQRRARLRAIRRM